MNASGELQRGERSCSFETCSTDGQTGCLATADLPVALKEDLAEKIVLGESFPSTIPFACVEARKLDQA